MIVVVCSERVLISEAAVLDQLSLKGLKKLCNSFGVDTTGSQADLVDRATAHCLVKIESILEPAVDFDALLDMAGQAVLDSAPAEEAAVEPAMPCTRTKSCTCPLCDAGYAALAEVLLKGSDGPLSQIWRQPDGDGCVFVGGLQAASDLMLLKQYGVTHIVNCMNRPRLNVQPGMQYWDFPIATHAGEGVATAEDPQGVLALFEPVMQFIQAAVAGGGSVLIHCFAGAHRAGTTGVAYLMHTEAIGAEEALLMAQQARPMIDPQAYGELNKLLLLLEKAQSSPVDNNVSN